MGNESMFEDRQNQNYSDEYVPYSERPETYIVPVLFAIIFLVGVLGNGTLVLIFARHRTMRNVPNTYILSLALGDLLVIITCVPFTSLLYSFESYPWGELTCKLQETSKDISIGVSVFTLTALSAERYCAIVNPIRRHVSRPLTIVIAIAIWIFSIILAMPAAVFSTVLPAPIVNNRTIEYCTPFPEEFGPSYSKTIVLFKFLTYYAVPLSIIGGFYVLMARHLVLSTRNMPGEQQGQTNQVKARKKVAKMVLAFVIIFIICFLPFHIFSLWFHFYPYSQEVFDEYWNAFRIVGFCLCFINSCVNPIALYCVSKTFRRYFNKYIFCCLKRSSTSMNEVTVIQMNSSSCRRHNSVITSHYTISHSEKT